MGIGTFDKPHSLHIKGNAEPCIIANKWIVIALKGKIRTELDDLVRNKEIIPVEEPAKWVSQLVIVRK